MRYFKQSEFECNCGCGMTVQDDFKQKLDNARHNSRTPYVLNSAARCEYHNKKVGGSPTSSHIKGVAADISYSNIFQLVKIIYGLSKIGFNRIGVNNEKKFIHVDQDEQKNNAIWSY